MKPSLRTLFLESPSREAVRREIARYAREHVPAGTLVLDLGGGIHRSGDVFPRYAAVNRDAATRPEVVADLAALPLRARGVAACLSVAVLEHLPDPSSALAEIARVLAPGGTAFLWIPFLHEVHPYPADHRRFTIEGVRSLVREAGLEPLCISSDAFAGPFWTLAHLYRFVFQPTPRFFRLKLAGFSILHGLSRLDRSLPRSRFYTGVSCIARSP